MPRPQPGIFVEGTTVHWFQEYDIARAAEAGAIVAAIVAIAEQERVIGRTKPDSVELTEHELPENAHISRVAMDDDGNEVAIYRRSVPWGDSTESGLMFVGFTDELTKLDDMLHAMFGTIDGIYDHLIEYSRARTSSYYFAPDEETLSALVAGFGS